MSKEKLLFKSGPERTGVDPDDLAAFAEGAKKHLPEQNHGIQLPQFTQNGKRTETILFRCSQADFDDIAFVFESLNVKSRQNLLECILLSEIRRLAKQIKLRDRF
jgi:hypothetical protein